MSLIICVLLHELIIFKSNIQINYIIIILNYLNIQKEIRK